MMQDIMKQADKVLAKTYLRQPIVITRGEGVTVWDADGKAYTDFVAGIAVCNLGHAHPRIAKALCDQAGRLFHVSNLYYTQPQIELATWLVDHSFADRVFFCNSGAEANEAAIKLSRRYFHEKGEARHRIVSAEKSFHGRTMATLSATGQDKIKKGFHPVLGGFDFVPFNDIDAMEKAVDHETCAVILEPIQGEGGIRMPDSGYLAAVRRLCDDAGALLIFDEIQTGIGRTGKLFAHEHFGVVPDIMSLAKALANGLPIGAMLAREDVAEAFGPGAHATTFGGTPVITAAAIETLSILTEEGVIEKAVETGDHFLSRLRDLRDRHPVIVDVRGKGLMIGMELSVPGAPLVTACLKRGFLVNCIQENILRFAPPLIIEKAAVDALVDCLDELLSRK
ncbi:acetylornithine transaminase [Desulfococcus multivorans]|uniref:Acetylornithine aminotransferase n=1 Tax=Desulfococcus multivorans DSM 2059 TaxID=1121405 RepID=S7U5W0_DESML|nr:acetylornithine transaminase [Desulfococcus multivorans]AOY59090.1 ArgD: acetylornithine aminotransferase [Desulfococcus multivorans]AQV03010.2 aspartate aminotransferase family protein [Desulfococcus multivorans]EPR44901.1 Acetylornithine/succinyldiaminopimelate aminotransferase [Desulfococcus multivorans DSM 2059]SJZ82981.1 acetylornithine aminotransferase apoenzyme [Desulfococcus multivorans DSM 2059]